MLHRLDFRLLKIYKKLGLHFSTITFAANSHAENHFCKYIYLFQILYSMKSIFIKTNFEVFYIQIWFNEKYRSYFFQIKTMIY